MPRVLKKHSSILAWVLLPSFLLLVIIVLGINLISRPAITIFGQACVTSADCTDSTGCRNEVCNSNACALGSPPYNGSSNICLNCNVCGNGRCEFGPTEGFDSITSLVNCPQDCASGGGGLDVCSGGDCNCNSIPDQCCCPGCSGDPQSNLFDADCCLGACGNGLIDQASETCDGAAVKIGLTPPASGTCRGASVVGACTYCGDALLQSAAGEACDPGASQGSVNNPCLIGTVCGPIGTATACTCVPLPTPCPPPGPNQIACTPTTNSPADACDPVTCTCTDVLEGGGPPFNCGGRQDDATTTWNAACVVSPSAGGGSSVIPTPITNAFPVLRSLGWGGVFLTVPSLVYGTARLRRKHRK